VRATTIRFPKDLWAQLEREAKKQGVSVAQYVRDAALYRVVFSAAASETNSHGELPPARARPE
jgi:predicted HicB family RNase H-like nuclease